MKASIKTVAKEAGVSISTVSRVLRNYQNVREHTRKEVLRVIKKQNYEINSIARSLREKRTNTIGIVMGNVLSPFHSMIAKSVEDVAHKNNFNLILCNSDDDPEKELRYLKVLRSNRVDGILIISTGENSEYINFLIKSGIEMVLINELIDGVKCSAVTVDNELGAYEATKYLINKGHKRIGIVVSFSKGSTTIHNRFKGYLRALKENNIPRDDNIISFVEEENRHNLNIDLAKHLIKKVGKPSAVFTTNLDATLGMAIAIKELGLKVPEDIEIACFDDSIWFSALNYNITSVRQPENVIGTTAAELLIKNINEVKSRENDTPLILTLKTELVLSNKNSI